MMKNIFIRKGKIDDKDDFIKLIIYTGEELFTSIFGKNVRDILKKIYLNKKNQFSYEFTYFAIYENRVAGMMLSYSYDNLIKTSLNTGFLLIKVMRLNFFKILKNLIKSFFKLSKLNKDEFYISNIAVYPEYRGLGIGKELLKFAENIARSKKLKKLSLDVEKENYNAINFYKRFGYKIERGFSLILGKKIFNFYRMSKLIF